MSIRIIAAILALIALVFVLFGNYERSRIIEWLESKSPGLKNLLAAMVVSALMCAIVWCLTPYATMFFI